MLVFGFTFAIGPTSEFFAGNPTAIRLSAASVALIFAVLGFRVLRLAIVAAESDLIVRNVLRTYRVARSEISHFEEPPRYGSRLFKTGLIVRLASGKTLSASAFARTPVADPGLGVRVAEQLNLWLRDGLSALKVEPRLSGAVAWLWWAWLGVLAVLTTFALMIVVSGIIDPSIAAE